MQTSRELLHSDTTIALHSHVVMSPLFISPLFSVLFSYQGNLASSTLDTILSIQPKDSSSGGGETRESIVRRQAGEMLEKLPANYIPHEVDPSSLSSPTTCDHLPPSPGEGKAGKDGGHCPY